MELKRGRAATKLTTKNPKNTKTHEEFSTTEARRHQGISHGWTRMHTDGFEDGLHGE